MNGELSRRMPFSLEAEQSVLGAILMLEGVLSAVTVLTSVKIKSYAEPGYFKKHRQDKEQQ